MTEVTEAADNAIENAIEIRGLQFGWGKAEPLLEIASLEVRRGERLFLRGASGSGKSTLLGLITGVLAARTGSVRVLGQDLGQISGSERDRLRAERMGVIFQMFNLLPYLSVVGNVTLGCDFAPERRRRMAGSAQAEARRLLARLGLTDEALLARNVRDLSVGQQQRVAAARALIGGPDIVIADEPTSALDASSRDRFIELLVEEVGRTQATLLFVSHDAALGHHFDRAIDIAQINSRAQVTA